ncbi:MAG: ATP synthase F1 subunit gamma [Dehalococcoidia bacterium]|nr:ATP synthase F1 subunit gamma [Dehalococcoidia bacterium]
MASTQILRRRIRSVEGTAKICRAMEMIATAKRKRTQNQALAGRPYNEKISQVIADMAIHPKLEGEVYPLLEARKEIRRIAIIYVATDRGLCGGLNANLSRLVAKFILEQDVPVTLITVGRKGRSFARHSEVDIRAEFSGMSDRPALFDTLPISRVVIDDFISETVDKVYLAYPRFVNTAVQQPVLEALLPVEPPEVPVTQRGGFIWEPGPRDIADQLLPRYVEMEVYHAVLELVASEQSARMVAMRNAGDSAKDVIQDLVLTLNKARQETVTKEICDICGGVESLES